MDNKDYKNSLLEKGKKEDLHPENDADAKVNLGKAALDIIKDALPSTLGILFIFICETINIIFIGKYNDPTLISGIGIGTLYINATGYILGAGLIGGLDTLCSQSFGAKKFEVVGVYANITRMVVICFFLLFCLPAVYFCSSFLLMLGQFSEVVAIAARFCHSMVPSLFFALQYNTSLRYLQAMNIFTPGMFVTLTSAALHPLWCQIFINYMQMDVAGAGVAMGVTQFINFVLISAYIHIKNPCPESYFFYHPEVFDGEMIWKFLKKAVPAAILFAADWLGFEILTLMSSYLTPSDLAANICLFNFITLIFMIPMGLSFAATTLVGNSIGERRVNKAKTYQNGALLCSVGIISGITLFVLFFRQSIPYVYTSEVEIAQKVTGLLGIYVCFSIVDSIQMILHGVIKGLGKQKIASVVCLVILYPINIPLAYTLCFVYGYGLNGLWYSQLCSVFLLATSYIFIVNYLNWEKIALHAVVRSEKDEKTIIRRGSRTSRTSRNS